MQSSIGRRWVVVVVFKALVVVVQGCVAQVALVAEVMVQVAPVAEVMLLAQSCWCRHRSHSRRVRPGAMYDTAWSSIFSCCIIGLRRISIVKGRTGTLGHGSWSSQGAPIRIVSEWLGQTC